MKDQQSIECKIKYLDLYLDSEKKNPAHGIYTNSWLSAKNYGKTVWGVCVNIELDYEKAKKTYNCDKTIVEHCIEFLNIAPKSKYGRTRQRKPLYQFIPTAADFRIIKRGTETYISATLLIRENKNEYFLGSGIKF